MMASAGVTALLKKMDYKVVQEYSQGKMLVFVLVREDGMQSTYKIYNMFFQDVVIAIDGSLFRFHPHFKNVMQSRISQMMGINFKFDLLLSEVLPSLFQKCL